MRGAGPVMTSPMPQGVEHFPAGSILMVTFDA